MLKTICYWTSTAKVEIMRRIAMGKAQETPRMHFRLSCGDDDVDKRFGRHRLSTTLIDNQSDANDVKLPNVLVEIAMPKRKVATFRN